MQHEIFTDKEEAKLRAVVRSGVGLDNIHLETIRKKSNQVISTLFDQRKACSHLIELSYTS